MKYSKSFAKTKKVAKDYDSTNATLLMKAGFINQTMAGVYSYLPLGMRVLNKIEGIVREEMDKIGEEILMPALAPTEFWKKTGRYDDVNIQFKAMGANEKSLANNPTEYALNPTHEEVVTPLVMGFVKSYKELPFAVYQIQNKFRNEARPKSGLLRVREFIMKDLYSFHTSEEDLLRFYNNEATDAYNAVFRRVGLGEDTVEAYASGGDFTKEYSKEFQTKCETGEDTIFMIPGEKVGYNKEVAPSQAPKIKQDSEMAKMEVIETAGVVGMEDLPKFLGVPAEMCMKTLIYEADNGDLIVAGVMGLYDINEEKLAKVAGVDSVELASEEAVKKVTGADVGYAGIVGLPDSVRLFVDESMEHHINFECGGNKTDHHNINVNWDVDVPRPEKFYDIKTARPGDIHPESGKVYQTFAATEVGNIFPLNTKFSDAFGFKYTDQEGKEYPVYMGSYGVGVSRLMGVVAEKMSDSNGLIWPISIAPYHVHLIDLGKSDAVRIKANALYEELNKKGIEVFWDDRENVSAGVKFKDADLLGMPIRLVISDKSMEQTAGEVKFRTDRETIMVQLDEVADYLHNKIGNMIIELNNS